MKAQIIWLVMLPILTNSHDNNHNRDQIHKIRDRILEQYASNPNLYSATDINRVKTEDEFIERQIIANNGDESKTLSALTEILQWRKSYGLNERNDSYFPAEFFALQYSSVDGKWTNGEKMFIAGGSNYYPPSSKNIRELFTQFVIHMMNKFDTETTTTSAIKPIWILFYNWSNKNFDLAMYEQYISFFARNMPAVAKQVIGTGLVPIMQESFNIIKRINTELLSSIHFTNDTKGFFQLTDQPKVFGGQKLIKRIPNGVKSSKCLSHLRHITPDEWEDFYARNIDLLLSAAEDDGAGTLDNLFNC